MLTEETRNVSFFWMLDDGACRHVGVCRQPYEPPMRMEIMQFGDHNTWQIDLPRYAKHLLPAIESLGQSGQPITCVFDEWRLVNVLVVGVERGRFIEVTLRGSPAARQPLEGVAS